MARSHPLRVLHVFANNSEVPYLSRFAESAKAEGRIHFIFVVLHHERPRMMEEMRSHGFDVRWIRFDPAHRKRGMIRALPVLCWHILHFRPDVVHGHLFDDTLPAMLAAWLMRTPLRMYTRQDTGFHGAYAPRWSFLDRLNAKLASLVVAVSYDAKALMVEKEGIPAEKITVVHHGVPPEPYEHPAPSAVEQLRGRYNLHGSYPVIGTVARFIKWKGYRHIVDAAKLLVPHHPNARFLFAGTGPQREEVRQWVRDSGLDGHVIFAGWVDRAEIPALFALMDVYLHAADHEPFGFVFAEAMFSSVPIVSTATGAAKDGITDGVNGILVPERSGQALATGVGRLLHSDLIAIGKAGHGTAMDMYTFDRMWAGYRMIYEKYGLPDPLPPNDFPR